MEIVSQKFTPKKTLKHFASYCIGGPSDYFFLANNVNELRSSIRWCIDNGVPYFLIGKGTNILISDSGFPGLVIKLGAAFKKIVLDKKRGICIAGGAVSLLQLGRKLVNLGWRGFEFMCCIPGSVGGAVRINAGTKDGRVEENFLSSKILGINGKIKEIQKKEMDFGYRYSRLVKSGEIVLESSFTLKESDEPEVLQNRVQDMLFSRRLNQPANRKNCGSIFRNPPGNRSAGWFLDHAGLKGTKIGNAMVATEHANWIVNLGNASSEDIKKLIKICQARVFEKFGVTLEREVIFVPDDVVSGRGNKKQSQNRNNKAISRLEL